EYRFPGQAALARTILGHSRAQLGYVDEGIALIRQGIGALVKIGHCVGVPSYISWLAVAQLRDNAFANAADTIERALDFNPEEVVVRPEILRIRGEIRLKQRDIQLAEADFRDSLAMARSMGAKAWELRTTMSLTRLLASKGLRDEARAMLAEIHNWFTEG